MRTAVGLKDGLNLDGDRCITVIPRQFQQNLFRKCASNIFILPVLDKTDQTKGALNFTFYLQVVTGIGSHFSSDYIQRQRLCDF